jgi:hypothetical protein
MRVSQGLASPYRNCRCNSSKRRLANSPPAQRRRHRQKQKPTDRQAVRQERISIPSSSPHQPKFFSSSNNHFKQSIQSINTHTRFFTKPSTKTTPNNQNGLLQVSPHRLRGRCCLRRPPGRGKEHRGRRQVPVERPQVRQRSEDRLLQQRRGPHRPELLEHSHRYVHSIFTIPFDSRIID